MSAVTSSAVTAQITKGFFANLDNVQMPPAYEQYRAEMRESVLSVLTPLNLTLLAMLATVFYLRFVRSPGDAATLAKEQPIVFSTFTPRILLRYAGKPNEMNPDGKVYLAVKGKVHDVTGGRNFYGPGGPYENFAGRDATRGLACQSFDEDMLTKNLDGPLDDCADLTADQKENLQSWVDRFNEKYLVVGKLVAFNANRQYGF